MRSRQLHVLCIILVAAATACTSVTGPAEADLAASIARWKQSGLVSYSYKSGTACFCPAEYVNAVTITVRAGLVTGTTDRLTGAARPTDGRVSIDSLFGLVATEIRLRPERLQVTYDPILGYPRSLTYGTPENDGGGYITADSVVAIP